MFSIIQNPKFPIINWFILCAAATISLLSNSDTGFGARKRDWSKSDRSSVGLSPLPKDEPGAVVQGFAARAVRWRGIFSVHTWIAVKEKNGASYRVYNLVGWRLRRNQSTILVEENIPDRKWYGHKPTLLFDLRGEKAERVIPLIDEAVKNYPYPNHYRPWPGPNSNTFISYILRRVPDIGVELPPNAIGRDWINNGDFFGSSESGTGFQLSLFGLLGLTMGVRDGIEVNIIGLSFGLDVLRPALKLPLAGRLGMRDKGSE